MRAQRMIVRAAAVSLGRAKVPGQALLPYLSSP